MAATIPGNQQFTQLDSEDRPPQFIKHHISTTEKSISAISGAFLTSLLVTPLDVVRVRLQSQQPQSNRSPLNASGRIPRVRYSTLGADPGAGVTACCREVFFSRGFNVQGTALQCDYIPYESAAIENGFCAAEETKRRTFTGTWEGLVKIARNEGILSLWRGLSPTLYCRCIL